MHYVLLQTEGVKLTQHHCDCTVSLRVRQGPAGGSSPGGSNSSARAWQWLCSLRPPCGSGSRRLKWLPMAVTGTYSWDRQGAPSVLRLGQARCRTGIWQHALCNERNWWERSGPNYVLDSGLILLSRCWLGSDWFAWIWSRGRLRIESEALAPGYKQCDLPAVCYDRCVALQWLGRSTALQQDLLAPGSGANLKRPDRHAMSRQPRLHCVRVAAGLLYSRVGHPCSGSAALQQQSCTVSWTAHDWDALSWPPGGSQLVTSARTRIYLTGR